MIKNCRNKIALSTLLLLLLVSSYGYLVSGAQAESIATAPINQQGLSVISNVNGLDISKYTTKTADVPNDLYQNVLTRENIQYTSSSQSSNVTTLCTFVNGSLQMLKTLDKQGQPILKTSTSNIGMAQGFLSRYQDQTGNAFYSQLGSMLNKVDASKNSSVTMGNIKLTIVTIPEKNDVTFSWVFTANGIDAPNKCVSLRYLNGYLEYYVDNWKLHNIGSTTVNLSETDAINSAMAQIRNGLWTDEAANSSLRGQNYTVTNAMVIETILSPSTYVAADKVHSTDTMALYPLTHVWVSLDKFYGNVYGFDVYIWADTKQVAYAHERVSTVDPPADLVATDTTVTNAIQTTSNSIVSSGALSAAAIMICAVISVTLLVFPRFLGKKQKEKMPRSFNKTFATLLCFLLLSSVLLSVASVASATPYNGRSTIWGAESTGSRNPPNTGESWRKTNNEVYWQQQSTQYINSLFSGNGYYTSNYQGSQTTKSNILTQASTSETNYPRVAVVYFDHGVGRSDYSQDYGNFHYMVEDNYGTKDGTLYPGTAHPDYGVYDMDIFGQTSGKTFFAFINTCHSAGTAQGNGMTNTNKEVGMPYAWTHKMVGAATSNPPAGYMSGDGYNNADYNNNVYIGFDGGSAALEQSITGTNYAYYYWVYHFFYYALSADRTVNNALDLASHDAFAGYNGIPSPDFDQTPLYSGYTSIWPMYFADPGNPTYYYWHVRPGYETGTGQMKVYGNGNLKLYQPLVTLSNSVGAFYVDGTYFGTGTLKVTTQSHTFDVSIPSGRQFNHFVYHDSTGDTYIYYRPVSLTINRDATLTAYYT